MKVPRAVHAGLADFFDERKHELVAAWRHLLLSLEASHCRDREPEEVAAWTLAGVDALIESLRRGTWEPLEAHAEQISRQRGRQGFDIAEVAGGLVLLKAALTPPIVQAYATDPELLVAQISLLDEALRRLLTRFTANFADEMARDVRSRAELTEALLEKQELPEILDTVCRETIKLIGATGCAIFADSTVPTIIEDVDGKITDVNDAAAALYGWSRDELVGSPITQLVPEDLRDQAQQMLERCRTGEAMSSVETFRLHRDGTRIPVLLTLLALGEDSGSPVGIVSQAQDITVQKRTAERLDMLSKVFADSTVPTLIEDHDGKIIDVNDAVVAVYGWSRDELRGSSIARLVPEDLQGQAQLLLERCREGHATRNFETFRLHRDGTRIPVLLSLSPLGQDSGKPPRIVSQAQDITVQKRTVERQLRIEARLAEAQKHESLGPRDLRRCKRSRVQVT